MDKSKYSFYTGLPEKIDSAHLQRGVYLWVIHANKIPPHVGLSQNGKYFSLKANGKDENMPVKQVSQILEKKKIATLFFEIDSTDKRSFATLFESYKQIEPGKTSCLSPIVSLLLPEDKDLILAELLEKLNSQKRIKSIFALHLEADFSGIPIYTREEITNRILNLQHAKRSNYLFEGY